MPRKFKKGRLKTFLYLALITLNGCSTTQDVKPVTIDSFCNGKYTSFYTFKPNKQDEINISKIRQNESFRVTFDKFTDHATIHEKEYEKCLEEGLSKEEL